MKSKIFHLLLVVGLLLVGSSAALKAQSSRLVTDSLYSHILEAWVKYNVYLPEGYEASTSRLPVVYLLHGLYGTYEDWENLGGMKIVTDELVRSGEIRKMVIVMPNAGGQDIHHVRNGYFNVNGWAYETAFFDEFLPAVERKYRCIGDRSHRAIMGLSMGGGGSTVYALRHPEIFGSCYAMSAWLDCEEFENRKNDPGVEKDCYYDTCESVRLNAASTLLGGLDDKALQRVRDVKFFLDCGDDDGLLYLSVLLHRQMKSKGIHSELRVRNGVHNWEYWHTALRLSLPFASRNFTD